VLRPAAEALEADAPAAGEDVEVSGADPVVVEPEGGEGAVDRFADLAHHGSEEDGGGGEVAAAGGSAEDLEVGGVVLCLDLAGFALWAELWFGVSFFGVVGWFERFVVNGERDGAR